MGSATRAAAPQQRRVDAELNRVHALKRAQEEIARAKLASARAVREKGEQRDDRGRRTCEEHFLDAHYFVKFCVLDTHSKLASARYSFSLDCFGCT